MKISHVIAYAIAALSTSTGLARTPAGRSIFDGRNVYSPSLEYDAEEQTYRMWYGGWQSEADYPHDKIYYRTSKDGLTWSAPRTVLAPSQLPVPNTHVNDPTVVKIINSITNKPQYTMFYTVCLKPCTRNAHNQIWSSVSNDGVTWVLHKPLIRTNGAAVPTAVVAPQGGSSVWRVYYSNTAEANDSPRRVFMADVDGNRDILTKDIVAFTYKGPGVIANPEVRNVGGIWNLVFNVYETRPGAKRNTADIYLAQSSNPRSWPAGSERPLVLNDPAGDVCATVAPAILPLRGGFLLQFGEARYSPSGTCDFSTLRTMRQLNVKTGSLHPPAAPAQHSNLHRTVERYLPIGALGLAGLAGLFGLGARRVSSLQRRSDLPSQH